MISRQVIQWTIVFALLPNFNLSAKSTESSTVQVDNKLVVISAWKKNIPNIQGIIEQKIIAPLEVNLKLVSFDDYKSSAKKYKIKRSDYHKPVTLHTVANELGISHALILELNKRSRRQTRSGQSKWEISVDLVNAETKETIWESSYDFRNQNIANRGADIIISKTIEFLQTPTSEPELAVEPLPVAKKIEPKQEPEPEPEPEQEPKPEPKQEISQATSSETPILTPTNTSANEEISSVISFTTGLTGTWRSATLSGTNSTEDVTYNTKGFSPGLLLKAQLFPFELLQYSQQWLQSIGVYGDMNFFRLNPSEYGQEIDSNASGQYGLGTFYRHRFSKTNTGGELQAKLGYQFTAFPVGEASFPGTKYHVTSLALEYSHFITRRQLKIPYVDRLRITGQLGYHFGVFRSGKLKRLGTHDNSLAMESELAVYAYHADFSLGLVWSLDYFSTGYKNQSTLPKPVQFTDASLSDSVQHIGILFGYDYDFL